MDRFVTFIEDTLHMDADASVYDKSGDLPLYLRNGYSLLKIQLGSMCFLLAEPITPSNLTVLRKDCKQLKILTGLDCVLCLNEMRIYTKEKMLSEGIPFVVAGKQVYMPFLGVALSQTGTRDISQVEQISYITQKLILAAIYQSWSHITLTEIAKKLNVSKMTITRCFDEIQSMCPELITTERKMRRFTWKGNRRDLWYTIRPHLRNPVIRKYRFGECFILEAAKLSGISAISHYSMLADDVNTVSVSKADAIRMNIGSLPTIPVTETPEMIVHVMSYDLDYGDNTAVDPLTAILSLTDEDLQDPRVESSVEDILEDCFND